MGGEPGQALPATGEPTRRALLVAHTQLSWRYVREHARLLQDDPRIQFAVTRAPDDYGAGVDARILRSGYPIVPLRQAIGQPWDLALFGTHGSDVFFGRTTAKVHIQHGIGAGKMVGRSDFTYGSEWALWRGRPKYTAMLEASRAVRDRAVSACPELAPVITVVGDMASDRLLASLRHREAYRHALGIQPDRTAVLLISTWGQYGLVRRLGPRLLPAALELGQRYRPMLTMHPHVWNGRHGDINRWAGKLSAYARAGLRVCGPDEDWVPYLAAADVAVVDHGSLGVYWSQLLRPTVTLPAPEGACVPDSPMSNLGGFTPTLADPDELGKTVEQAMATFDPAAFAKWRGEVVSYPGQAAFRTREVLYRLLGLRPIGAAPQARLKTCRSASTGEQSADPATI